MKIFNISLFFIILFLFNICLIAQNLEPYKILPFSVRNEIDSLNYFPHAVGNTWQYQYNDGRIFKEVISKDSLLTDSSKLLLFLGPLSKKRSNDIIWSYRITKNQDSVIQWPYTNDILLYKFPMNTGDKWMLWDSVSQSGYLGYCTGEFDENIFGVVTKRYDIEYHIKFDYSDTTTNFYDWAWSVKIANGFGKIWWGNEVEYYQLMGCIIEGDTIGIITSVEDAINSSNSYELYQNYPNPFNSNTKISFYLPYSEYIQIIIYNLLGQVVQILIKDYLKAGFHSINFKASNLTSGIYYYKLVSKKNSITKKMIYLK